MTFTRRPEPTADAKPKRSRPSRAKSTGMPRAKLREGLDQLVTLLNTILASVSPYDALQPKEVAVLVNALDEQAATSPRLRRGMEALLSVTSGGSLGLVVGIIIGRRLARSRVFGPRFSPLVDAFGMATIEAMDVKPSEATEAMNAIMAAFDQAGGAAAEPETNGAANVGSASDLHVAGD